MTRRPPTIVVTRDDGANGALTRALARRGARVFPLPAIAIEPPLDRAPLDCALSAPAGYDWVLFTSAHAVDAVCSLPAWAAARGALIAALANARARPRPWLIAAVGATTAERLASYGVPVDLVPVDAGAAGLTQALIGGARSSSGRRRRSGGGESRAFGPGGGSRPLAGSRILWPRSEIAGREIIDALSRAGAELTDPVAYRTVHSPEALRDRAAEFRWLLDAGEIDGITFMSPSSARGLAAALDAESLAGLAGRAAVASIGPTTSAALASLGAPADVESSARTADDLAEALMSWLEARQEVPR